MHALESSAKGTCRDAFTAKNIGFTGIAFANG
jgi:hypothetical protein